MKQVVSALLAAVLGGTIVAIAQQGTDGITRLERLEVRELTLVDQGGMTLAKLNSVAGRTIFSIYGEGDKPNIEVGVDRDRKREGRVILGAFQTDMPGAPVDDWGLRFPAHGSSRPVMGILLHDEKGKTDASIQLRRADGTIWMIN